MRVLPIRFSRALRGRKKVLIVSLVSIAVLAFLAGDHYRRWIIYLYVTGVPQTHRLSTDRSGYEIEVLPFNFRASFARDHQVYVIDGQGRVYDVDDRAPASAIRLLGDSHIKPRMLFVSGRGTIFVSGLGFPTLRSVDGGKTWGKSHDLSVWRITEDQASHTIYAGVYTRKERPLRSQTFQEH